MNHTITIQTTSEKLINEIEVFAHKRFGEMKREDLGEKGNYLTTTKA